MPQRPSTKTFYQEKALSELLAKGKTAKQVRAQLAINKHRYNYLLRRLNQQGHTIGEGYRKHKAERLAKRANEIAALRRAGKTNAAIAQSYQVSVGSVSSTVTQLAKQGEVQLRHTRTCFWRDPSNQRFTEFVSVVQEGKTLRSIGLRFGCSAERVRQLILLIAKHFGPDLVTRRPTNLLTTEDVSKALEISPSRLSKLCLRGVVKPTKAGGRYYFTPEMVPQLREYLVQQSQRCCCICGKTFTPESLTSNQRACSKDCAGERERRYRSSQATTKTVLSWRRPLLERLALHVRPASDRLVTYAEACRLTGLRGMPLIWLRQRQILKTIPHPELRWRGRPVLAFYQSELVLVREVLDQRVEEVA
ncbi:MAG: helix-turn-helix domain-containing protein [Candidatus Andersenbacteria bacterium]